MNDRVRAALVAAGEAWSKRDRVYEALKPVASHEAGFWLIAVIVGVIAGYAAVLFRLGIILLQTTLYGADDTTIHSQAAALNPFIVFIIPVLGGLAVGWVMQRFGESARPLSISDVISAAALRDARVDRRKGAASALASLITLSSGGSTGREGPIVHVGAVIASWACERLRLHGVGARDLLGCAVAAAVSASFNAPLAGAVFALEVVLRHYAVHAFGPIVVASVAGTLVSRVFFGDVTEYVLPDPNLEFYAEIPAFILLGVLSGLVGAALARSVLFAEKVGDKAQARLGLAPIYRPAVSGAVLGLMATQFPHIIGVGYETTSRALTLDVGLGTAIVFAVVKVVAVCVTFAGRMGGGIFSPALMLGALTGAAFGMVVNGLIPLVTGSTGLYALAGMGAVAAAVLGAPISTILIVFELTGDYQVAIAVMVSVSVATVVAHRFLNKSFFLTQIAETGIDLAGGPQGYLPRTIRVDDVMRVRGADDAASESACETLMRSGAQLKPEDTLSLALPLFDRIKRPFLPVVRRKADGADELIGALFHLDALKAMNRALSERQREEHS
ncbi:MAG: chloride channel protein [Rhodobacteraceae bacterium]|nr:MAG: chloride channel protein [Paracoccaceae bacterium]